MSASIIGLWVVLAGLNLSVAALMLSARPRRAVHVLVTALVGTNGVFGLYMALGEAGLLAGLPEPHTGDAVGPILNIPIFWAFVLLPFFAPRERLGPRATRGLLRAALVVVLLDWALVPASFLAFGTAGRTAGNDPVADPVFGPLLWIPFMVGLGVGTLVLLDGYLAAPGAVLRRQFSLLLAAYVLKVCNLLPNELARLGLLPFLPPGLRAGGWEAAAHAVPTFFLLLALFGPPMAIAASRLRARAGAPRPLREDLFVLSFPVLGIALALNLLPPHSEYMILRPLLLTYAILHYELIAIDVERLRAHVAATVLFAVGAIYLVTVVRLGQLGMGPDAGAALGFLAAASLGGALAWPLLRLAIAPMAAVSAARGRELYRVALAEALAAAPGDTSSNERVLRALRGRLRISEREHAALQAEVRAAAGRRDGELAVGALFLGRYRIAAVLGEGGFARTLRARDERLGRDVVLKVAHWTTREETRRALREGRILATLSHPNIVAVHDIEEVAGEVVLVLEHVPGGSLADRLRGGKLPMPEALRVADDVLAGLEAAHARGIVHRDVKPSNILLTADGRAKLADFGIAAGAPGAGTVSGTFTKAGAGTLRYMAPEQARGLEAEPRSDLYAVGVVLYEMLAGAPYLKLDGLAEFEVRRAILEEAPRLPLRGVPAQVNEALRRALAKDPGERPASAAELRRLLAAESPKAPQS